ncbi:MAG TPA: type II secretion system F family protein [Polyangiaceae bacterium]|jgi:tight adherence protein B|nr:MAG: Bacterial type II secretion system protein F domain protein [Deltaproteobacteria bacterium ADurb.Bin207]HNS99464.1 type II secretion system F family protein [Polyangiaceae bacterium]HNZ23730.1 type II secretion system F family protein [Polyangiaceae bacterium]HOD24880.1 type II secretion system F family protein [Polyangiaceae bacterium]HOE48955.1 type II secretion system F family protein [Polyangiaceae bacterium]
MNAFSGVNPEVFKWLGVFLIVVGVFIGTWSLAADPQSMVRRYWVRYLAHLDRKLRSMFIWTPAKYIAWGQLAAAFLVIAGAVGIDLPLWYAWLVLVAVSPYYYIERMRRKRVEMIEEQLDGFLVGLANALKAIPSISSAFVSVQAILRAPLRDEVELAIKEMRVGSTLEQALLNMAGRVGSRQLDSALSAIVIGRQIGGNLPTILETTAGTLREMARLEGVVKTKTAEGKAQLWVLAIFPFLMILALDMLNPGYFLPLEASVVGYIIAFFAGGFWLASLLVARKVLSVDI